MTELDPDCILIINFQSGLFLPDLAVSHSEIDSSALRRVSVTLTTRYAEHEKRNRRLTESLLWKNRADEKKTVVQGK